jgi:ribonuclease HI
MTKKKYYAVAVGRKPGIYTQWFGEGGAHAQVDTYKGARYKGFATIEEAHAFIREPQSVYKKSPVRKQKSDGRKKSSVDHRASISKTDRMVIYTDGSSLGNPGPGGYGVVIPSLENGLELSGGFRLTTNNRMELLACIVGLEQFNEPFAFSLYSDSRYVVDGITKGWAAKWQRHGWKKSTGEKALNVDLWKRLLVLCNRHDVDFIWVKGHAGNPGNERCDALATQAATNEDLAVDEGYEESLSTAS